jgi:hypothetical protein
VCVTVVYSGLWNCTLNWCCCCCFIQNSLETLLEYRIVASLDLRSRCDVILVCFLTLWCAAGLAFTCKLFKYIFTPDTVVLRERLQAPAKNMCRNVKWTMFWFLFHPKVRNNILFSLFDSFLCWYVRTEVELWWLNVCLKHNWLFKTNRCDLYVSSTAWSFQ